MEVTERFLDNGDTLRCRKYQITDFVADTVGRPRGSYEITIELKRPSDNKQSDSETVTEDTGPAASWYLGEFELRTLYDNIRTREDFYNLRKDLNDLADEKRRQKQTAVTT